MLGFDTLVKGDSELTRNQSRLSLKTRRSVRIFSSGGDCFSFNSLYMRLLGFDTIDESDI